MLDTSGYGKMLPTINDETTMSSNASTTDSHFSPTAFQRERVHPASDERDYAIAERIFWVGLVCWTFGQITYRLLATVPA